MACPVSEEEYEEAQRRQCNLAKTSQHDICPGHLCPFLYPMETIDKGHDYPSGHGPYLGHRTACHFYPVLEEVPSLGLALPPSQDLVRSAYHTSLFPSVDQVDSHSCPWHEAHHHTNLHHRMTFRKTPGMGMKSSSRTNTTLHPSNEICHRAYECPGSGLRLRS